MDKTAYLPIIQDLQAYESLLKCPHGETQNTNEAIKRIIWARIPKRVWFVGRTTLEIGAKGILQRMFLA